MLKSYLIKKLEPKLTGKFLGRVVQDYDELGCNRVKVSLVGITDKLAKSKLPYYRVATTVNDTPNTTVNVPPNNSKVMVELAGDIYNGVVVESLTHIAPV